MKFDNLLAQAVRLCGIFLVVLGGAAAWACSGSSDEHPVRHIVYEASGSGGVQVYATDPVTETTVQLTSGSARNNNPAWSPDGQQIIFLSDRQEGQVDVYVMNADGTEPVQLTDSTAREIAPKFSPDGTQIAYAADDEGEWSLWVMNADGSGAREVAGPYRFLEFPSWRPGRNEIFYSAIPIGGNGADVLGVDLDSGEVSVVIATGASDVCPHFSHDGKFLTYATDVGDAGEIDVFRHDLESSVTDGTGDVRLTNEPGVDDYANYSPDDTQLVFVTRRGGESELFLMAADGSEQRPLTRTPGLQENVPDW